MTTNSIRFERVGIEITKGVGSITALTLDINITVKPVTDDNPSSHVSSSRPFTSRSLG